MPTTARLAWLDTSKGLGIVLVVVAHVLLRSEAAAAGYLAPFIYLFHMPLFFIIAGVTLKPEPLGAYTLRKATTLLLPYTVFLCLLGVPSLIATCGMGISVPDLGIDRCPVMPLKLLAGGSLLGGIFGAFWFIPSLFGALVLAQFILNVAGTSNTRKLIACCGLAILAYTLPALLPQSTALLSIGTVPMACVFVLTGYALRNHLPRLKTKWVLAVAAIAVCIAVMRATFDMKAAHFGIPVLSATGAVALACLVLWLANALFGSERPARILAALGQRSLTVLYLHQAIHLMLRHWGFVNDIGLIALSLAVPTLLHRPFSKALQSIARTLDSHLFRNSPKAVPPLR